MSTNSLSLTGNGSGVFEQIAKKGHQGFEQIVFCQDASVGLKAIIAIHSRVLGPGVGGCRMWNYASESEALNDVLRLSRGMTYKASVAGLNWGGAKAVIIGDSKSAKSPALLKRFGEYVDRLNGNYVTAKDVGIGSEDLALINTKTKHVLGIDGVAGSSGDPSPGTAWGVYHGIKSAVKHVHGSDSLNGLTIAVQGLGSVSYYLLEHLNKEGAKIIGCDVDPVVIDRAVKKYNIQVVDPNKIYDVKCDLFSPNALGSALNPNTIDRISAKIIAGAANNQLATDEIGFELMKRGVLYAPDYAINAGGLMNIYHEREVGNGYDHNRAFAHIAQIGQVMTQIFDRAKADKQPTHVVADRLAEERIEKAQQK